jgi:hypothetical protein
MLFHKTLRVTVSAKTFGDGAMKSRFSAMNGSGLFGESKGKRQRIAISYQGRRASSFKVLHMWKL